MELLRRMQEQWDRCSAAVFVIAAVIVLILGYIGVANTEFVAAQIPYFISGGVFSLLLLGAGGVLWLSADLRDEWVKLDQIEEHLIKIEDGLNPQPTAATAIDEAPAPHPAKDRQPTRRRRTEAPA